MESIGSEGDARDGGDGLDGKGGCDGREEGLKNERHGVSFFFNWRFHMVSFFSLEGFGLILIR